VTENIEAARQNNGFFVELPVLAYSLITGGIIRGVCVEKMIKASKRKDEIICGS